MLRSLLVLLPGSEPSERQCSAVFHQLLKRFAELLGFHEGRLGGIGTPDFNGVVHAYEAHRLVYVGFLKVAAGDKEAPVAIENNLLGIGKYSTENWG